MGNINGQPHSFFLFFFFFFNCREYITSVKDPDINQACVAVCESGSISLHMADLKTRQLEAHRHFYCCLLGQIEAVLMSCLYSGMFFLSRSSCINKLHKKNKVDPPLVSASLRF